MACCEILNDINHLYDSVERLVHTYNNINENCVPHFVPESFQQKFRECLDSMVTHIMDVLDNFYQLYMPCIQCENKVIQLISVYEGLIY